MTVERDIALDVVLGVGPGSYAAAERVMARGASVALLNADGDLGGAAAFSGRGHEIGPVVVPLSGQGIIDGPFRAVPLIVRTDISGGKTPTPPGAEVLGLAGRAVPGLSAAASATDRSAPPPAGEVHSAAALTLCRVAAEQARLDRLGAHVALARARPLVPLHRHMEE